MFSTKKSLDKILQIYKNEIRRQISKTTSVTNSDAMVPRLDQAGSAQQADEAIGTKKLLKLQKYHRYLSTLTGQQMPLAARGLAVSKDQSREFMACFPDIIRDLTESGKHNDVPHAAQWLAKLLQYNVPNGKKNRGLATVLAYKMLEKPENMTPENVHLANIMGWCVEMFHTQQMLLNDIMEGTAMRRDTPCWHTRPEVGLSGVNDAALVQSAMYSTLKRHFGAKPYYKNVLEMFNEMLVKCSVGHYLEKSINRTEKPDLSQFTMENYEAITKYKTAYYTFQMPVSLALLMAGVEDPETHRQAKTILLEMGEFFQIQDDFLDCFGDPTVTGKNGTDIQDGKCTWLAVVALQRATPAQKEIMEAHYASANPADVAKIKDLYEDLQLPHTFSVYEEATYDLLRTQIQQVTRGLPHDLFFKMLSTNVSVSETKEKETFQDVLPIIINTLSSNEKFAEVPEVATWIKKILDYNLAGGKKNRGVATVFAYEMSEKPENITEESLRSARILGWCVEMLQAYFLMMDDIIDGSSTRRGVPCWYRLPDIGLNAINDSILVYCSMYEVLRVHFLQHPHYTSLVNIFQEATLLTSAGQHLDLWTATGNKKNYSLFTVERYESIVKYKTAFYTIRLPVSLGLLLANITDKTTRKKADDICLDIGKLFQIQDDYIDNFCDESATGKKGTDIQEGKCCWPAVTALQLCTPAQRTLFEECYASKEPEHIAKIKALYEELRLPEIYAKQERALYDDIIRKTQELGRDTNLTKLFYRLVDMIYKRKH
ncbi:uncharacterized protein LOC126374264 [Pectinophora gossypiella]|uniref:uncharacterized protein LOC126374264 n=1 Tax=Pectinophora gossypiella TaxID=13191 RepID=UPI00214E427F|nr:uncharacterized protein LOC126374264 [Pectinophora gossypiella]